MKILLLKMTFREIITKVISSLLIIISSFIFNFVSAQNLDLSHTAISKFNLPSDQRGPESFGGFINYIFEYDCWTTVLNLNSKLDAGFAVNGSKYNYQGKTYDLNIIMQYDGRGLEGLRDIRVKSVSYVFKLSNIQFTKSTRWMESQFAKAEMDKVNRSYIDFTFDCDKYTSQKVKEHVKSIGFTIVGISSAQFENTEVVEERIKNYIKYSENKQSYDKNIKQADDYFAKQDYSNAKQYYTSAQNILPNVNYPQQQIDKINNILAKQKDNENTNSFNDLIKKGDASFNQKDYNSAKRFYNSANQIFPNESYPKNQIKRIDDLISNDRNTINSNSNVSSSNYGNSSSNSNNPNYQNNSNKFSNMNSGSSEMSNLSDKVVVKGIGNVQVYQQNGQYYMLDENGSSHVTSQEAFNKIHTTANNNKIIREQNAKNKTDYENAQKAEIERVNTINQNKRLEIQKQTEDFNKATDHLITSFYTMQTINNLRSDVDENRSLGSNFSSVEELEQAFQQKYSNLSKSLDNLHENEQNMNLNNLNYYSTVGGNQGATGTLVAGGMYIFNEIQNQKEKENALAELERQRKEALAEIERQKHLQLVNMRKELLSTFPEGGIPLSYHKINVQEIFFFVYSIDQTKINEKYPTVTLSNVFPWKKYSDETWPYRSALDSELKNKGLTNNTTLVGFYTSKEMAEEMRNSYIKLAEMSQLKIQDLSLIGKPSNTSNNTSDFWGESKATSKSQPEINKSDDDFWGVPVKQEKSSSNPLKTDKPNSSPKNNKTIKNDDDFWGEPIKNTNDKKKP
jgi:hypothetical protein